MRTLEPTYELEYLLGSQPETMARYIQTNFAHTSVHDVVISPAERLLTGVLAQELKTKAVGDSMNAELDYNRLVVMGLRAAKRADQLVRRDHKTRSLMPTKPGGGHGASLSSVIEHAQGVVQMAGTYAAYRPATWQLSRQLPTFIAELLPRSVDPTAQRHNAVLTAERNQVAYVSLLGFAALEFTRTDWIDRQVAGEVVLATIEPEYFTDK